MLFMLLNVIFATAGVILSILIIIQLLLLVSDHSVGMEVRLGNIKKNRKECTLKERLPSFQILNHKVSWIYSVP